VTGVSISRQIFDALAEGPQRAKEIAAKLGMPRKNVSAHLAHLRQRGLVANVCAERGAPFKRLSDEYATRSPCTAEMASVSAPREAESVPARVNGVHAPEPDPLRRSLAERHEVPIGQVETTAGRLIELSKGLAYSLRAVQLARALPTEVEEKLVENLELHAQRLRWVAGELNEDARALKCGRYRERGKE